MAKKNKAQLAIFVIISLILISIIFIIFYFKPFRQSKENEFNKIQKNLEECIKQISIAGLFEIGKQGGYYNINGTLSNYYQIKLPIFFENKKNLLPKIEVFEEEFSNYLKDKINQCFENLKELKNEGYKIGIDYNKTNIKVKFKEEIKIEVKHEIIVSKNNREVIFNYTNVALNFNFPEKYSIIQQIIKEQEKSGDFLSILYLYELSKQKNFNFELIDLQNGYYILVLKFSNNLKNEPYIFSFLLSILPNHS